MGVIDINGNQIIPVVYDQIFKKFGFNEYHYSGLDGYFVVQNGLVGYIDISNRIIIPAIYNQIVRFDLNIAEIVTRTGKKGFINLRNGAKYFEE